MARAKRTNRAEARRRYRATLADDADLVVEDEAVDEAEGAAVAEAEAAATPRRRRAAPPAPAPAPARPGLGSAFRASFRPIDVRADLRALPSLIRHRSVWLPVLITVAATAFFAAAIPPIPENTEDFQSSIPQLAASLLYQYFVLSPPIGSIFLAGFMAPRASYLTGGIAGLVGAICFSVTIVAGVGSFVQLTDVEISQNIAAGVFTSLVAGIFFGGAAGWYRRFLTLANPNRAARAAQAARQSGGRQRRRGGDQRPMLARRR